MQHMQQKNLDDTLGLFMKISVHKYSPKSIAESICSRGRRGSTPALWMPASKPPTNQHFTTHYCVTWEIHVDFVNLVFNSMSRDEYAWM